MTLNYDIRQFLVGIEYVWNHLTLSAEYGRLYAESTMGNIQIADRTGESYYGMASYRFTDWFEAGTYYSVLYGDMDDKHGELQGSKGEMKETAWLKDVALFTKFDINANWMVKFEGHYIDGLEEILDTTAQDLSDNGFLFAVKTTFSF